MIESKKVNGVKNEKDEICQNLETFIRSDEFRRLIKAMVPNMNKEKFTIFKNISIERSVLDLRYYDIKSKKDITRQNNIKPTGLYNQGILINESLL
jgi:hypothetical protein